MLEMQVFWADLPPKNAVKPSLSAAFMLPILQKQWCFDGQNTAKQRVFGHFLPDHHEKGLQ